MSDRATRPRVLHITPAYFDPATGAVGGGERVALEMAGAMAKLVPTRLAGFGSARPTEHRGELEIFTVRNQLPGRRFRDNPASLELLPLLGWADVIHCHQIYTVATSLAVLYGKAFRKPVFAADHGSGGVSLFGYFPVLLHWLAGRLWTSDFSRDDVVLPGDRTVYGGVDTAMFSPDPVHARCDELLYVGRIVPYKNLIELILALPPDTRLAVAGPDTDPDYAARVRRAAAGKPVRFAGPLFGEHLAAAYRSAFALVMPSSTEQLGLIVLEAMACGTPVIASARSGIAELFRDREEVILIPPSDTAALHAAIAWLRDDPRRRERMAAAARARVLRDFTWDAVARRCLAAYTGASPGDLRNA